MLPTFAFVSLLLIILTITTAQDISCSPGSFLRNARCLLCPEGTYQSQPNSTSCLQCPKGTYNPFMGAQGIDICIICPEGTFQDRLGATSINDCKPCPPNQNAPAGAPSCASCPAGTKISLCDETELSGTVSAFRGTCIRCIVRGGGFPVCTREGQTMTRCVECPLRATSGRNALECQQCPEGLFRLPTSATCGNRICPAGTGISSLDTCQECASYRVNDGSKATCEDCPLGREANQRDGATACIICPPDEFREDLDRECKKCASGLSSESTEGVLCLPNDFSCPSNFFRAKDGICRTCPLQTFYDAAKKECVPCPANQLSIGGVTRTCTPCPPSMLAPKEFNSIEDLRCFCQPGSGFVLGSNGMRCRRCAPGTVSDGTTSCRMCSRNTFAAGSGNIECTACPSGQIQPIRGARSCITPKCRSGLVVSAEGTCVLPATGCAPNSRREPGVRIEEQIICVPEECPPGQALITVHNLFFVEQFCGVCGPNERFVPGSSSCVSCRENEFSQGGLARSCKKCPRGQVYSFFYDSCGCFSSRQTRNGRCSKCPKGTFGFRNIEGCMACPAGSFSDRMGGFRCAKCPAGTFSSRKGSEGCLPCPEGKRSFGTGNTECS